MLTITLALAALTLTPNEGITWFGGSYEEALEAATSSGKHTLVYFWANTENCARMYNETLQADPVRESMHDAVWLSANAGEEAGRALLDAFRLETVPAILVLGPDGREEEMLTGFMDAVTFQAEMNRIRNGINTLSDLRQKANGRHEDRESEFVVLQMLGQKLQAIGEREQADEIFAGMLKKDARASTSTVSQMIYSRLHGEMLEAAGEDPGQWDVKPLERFVRQLPRKNEKGRFLGMIALGDLYQETEHVSDALATYADAWKECPGDIDSIGTAYGLLGRLLNLGDVMQAQQRQLALEIATELHGRIVASHAARCAQCDGSRDDCPTYRADEAAVNEGLSTGHFVTDRPAQSKPLAQYWLAKSHQLAGNTDEALALLRRASAAVPSSTFFADELVAMTQAN